MGRAGGEDRAGTSNDQERGADRSIGARLPALGVFAAAALLVVAIVGLGRIEVTPPDWQLDPRDPPPAPPPTREGFPQPTGWPQTASGEGSGPVIDIPWQAALLVLLVLLIAVAAYLLRRMPRGMFSRHRSRIVGGSVDDVLDQGEELRKAAETANAALAGGHANGHDAVVEAWLALEAAAEASGVPRRRSQTPSEFTTDLLRRHHADVVATAQLRDLYHRARFSAHPDITTDDVAAARRALAVIVDTISSPGQAEPSAATAPGPKASGPHASSAKTSEPRADGTASEGRGTS